MKKYLLVLVVGMIFMPGLSRVVLAQIAPTMYTLDDIYYYLTEGTPAVEGGHSLEPPLEATAGDTRFKTLARIYQDTKMRFDQCNATAADVVSGKVFFSVEEEGSWGIQTGRASFVIVTGQTSSYYSGDDGYYQAGRPYNYTDNWDGTITDNVTGLMWAQYGDGAGCYNGGTLNWSPAITWAEGVTFATYTDWRVPNIKELFSLSVADQMSGTPCINHARFPNTVSDYYWSSTTSPSNTPCALCVDFGKNTMAVPGKQYPHYIRVVRNVK